MNARQELIDHLQSHLKTPSCAIIKHATKRKTCVLRQGYSEHDYKLFLDDLDFSYVNGYEFYGGVVWYTDGSWSDWEIGQNSEWWRLHDRPGVPEVCREDA